MRTHACSGDCAAHPLEPIELLGDRVLDLRRCLELVEAAAELADDIVVALAELLADRVELLAQQELSLLLVHALADVVADRLRDLELVEVVAGPRGDRVDAVGDVDRVAGSGGGRRR